MKNNHKPRNREFRTKPNPNRSCVTIHLRVSRETYDQVKQLQRNRRATKEEIFHTGLQTYIDP